MAELPLDQAVPRFKANEDRLDTFVNSATGYTTSGGTSVQSIQQFLASIGSNGIDFVDNAKARFGTGNDLEIYHSGSGSFIRDTGTGDLTIDGSAISIQTASAERISVSASGIDVTGTVEFDGLSGTGSVTITDIADEDNMASNSATKLATQQSIKAYVDAQVGTADTLSEVLGLGNTTGGTDISVSANDDITFTDSSKAIFGASSDLQIYHDGSNSYISDTGTGDVIVKGQYIRLQDEVGTNLLTADGNDAVSLYFGGASKLATTTSGIDVSGNVVGDGLTIAGDATFTGGGTGSIVINDEDSSLCPTMTFTRNGGGTTTNDFIKFENSGGEVATINSTGGAFLSALNVTGTVEFDGLSGTGSVTVTDILDEDDMTSDSATALATQQSIKAYVDANAGGGGGLPTTGGTMTGDILFNDNVKAKYGDSNDLQIWHNGTHSYIKDVGTGDLKIDATNLELRNSGGGEVYLSATANGSVAIYNNNAKKLETTSTGIDVTGTVVADKMFVEGTADSRQWEAGSAGQKLAIYAYDNSTFYHRLETGNATNYQWGTYDNIPIYTITNNSIKTTLLANGNFGVGTTAPQVKLQTTVANASTEAIRITNDADSVRTHMFPAEIQAHNSNLTLNANDGGFATIIKTANTERMRIDSSGKVGIGTTAPKTKTQITSGGTLNAPSLGSSSSNAPLYLTNNDTNYGLVVGNSSADGHVWFQAQRTDGTATAYNITLNEAGGNVGIGTTSPNHELHIESTSPTIRLVDTDGNNTIDIGQSGSACYIDFDNTVRFRNLANVERLRVDSNGIDVTGDLTVTSTIEVGSLTPNQDGAIEVGVIALGTPAIASTTSSTGLMNHIIFDNPNGAVGKINTLNSSTTYLTSSDYRLKTDVQAMTGSIDRIKALRPVNFEWVVDGTRVDGFLAHEAQEVVPEAVDGEKDAMRDQQYVESEATGDIYTPAVDATYETIQVELTPAVDAVYETVTVEISPAVEATYDEDGNELTPAIEAVTEQQEQLVTPAVDATYEEQQQELTPAIDEVIHSSDVVEPDELKEGQLWRETTEKVMATRQVPDYQGIDQSKIVPLLTSALQDAIAKIEALETRLEALEA